MYHNIPTEELRAYCRTAIESLELWGRRLIDDLMSQKYGSDYLHAKLPDESPLIATKRLEDIVRRRNADPQRYSRWVDVLLLDDIRYILCKQSLYQTLFQPALEYVYKQGRSQADYYLKQLEPIRNNLSHANPISIRQAEKAICYSHDFIDGIREYYKDKGKERIMNVPTILKITDSLGNRLTQKHNTVDHVFYVGETYSIDAEIDSSFSPEEYEIKWLRRSGHPFSTSSNSPHFTITFSNSDVNESLSIRCIVTQKKPWHRYDFCDDEVAVNFMVLPEEAIGG